MFPALRKHVAALVIAVTSVAALQVTLRAEPPARAHVRVAQSVWDSVYTAAQAARGDSLYKQACAKCHGDTLTGPPPGAPDDGAPLVGPVFLANWNGLTVGDLYEKIRDYMPTDKPKTLEKQVIADVLAFVLAKNNFPAGAAELANEPEPLKEIKFVAKP